MQDMMWTVDLRGRKHKFRRCTLDDIDNHFEKVKSWLEPNEYLGYKRRMTICVEAGTAFCLEDESCFLYYKKNRPCCADGYTIYGKNSPLKMIALFSGIFRNIDKRMMKIDFRLHPGKLIDEYKSMLTEFSIQRQNNDGYPLIVRVDSLKAKIITLMDARGVKWEA